MRGLAVASFWLLVWALVSAFANLDGMLLPGFFTTMKAVIGLLSDGSYWTNLMTTLGRVIPGNVLATLAGVPIGLGLAASARARAVIEPLLSFFRGIPVAALFPVIIILFGIGEGARLALVLYVATPLIAVTTMSGAIERSEVTTRRDYLRLHRRQIAAWHYPVCLLWDALPSVLGGLKVALALSLVVIVVSEMFFVGGTGVGWYTWDQYQSFNLPRMYASIFLIGCISFALSKMIDFLYARVGRI